METIIIYPKTKEELAALKSVARALKIEFEVVKETPYNTEFVKKIKAERKKVEEGKFIKLDPTKSLWENLQ